MRKFTISLCAILFCISGYAQGAEVFKKQSFLDGSITSETLEVPQTNLQSNSYCTPLASGSSYRINSFSTTGGVQNVENLNSGFSNSGYGDFYSSHVVEQIKGGSIEFNAELSTGLGLRIWVDWNQDGLFDEAEEVAWFSSNFLQTQSGTIEVPTDAVVGETRMRMVTSFMDNKANDSGPCQTLYIWGEFEDYKFIVSEEDEAPEPEPENPCDDKIIMECGVEYTADLVPNAGVWTNYTDVTWDYNGSEQVFEFTAEMTGDYEFILDEGAADVDFFVMDACSNEANNLIGGYWTGSSDQTLFLTEGQSIYIIADLFSASTPSTLSIQVNCPTEPMLITCEDNFVDSNNLENGLFFGGDKNQRLAVDVIVGDEGFTVYGMDLNIFTDGNTELDFYFTVYEDDGGLPGAVFNDNGYGQVISNEYLGEAFGYDVYNFVVKFDSSIDLEANTTYWIEVESTGVAWEATEVNSFGSGLAFLNDNVNDWTDGSPDELVYSLVCEQLGVSDLSSFDFAYYPNPVRDVLNITSQKAVESVEAYNLTGQKVINESKVNQGQIDVSKLPAGTYVFRVTLEGGQVETFKIIKR